MDYVILYNDNVNLLKSYISINGNFILYVQTKDFTGKFEFCIETDNLIDDISQLSILYKNLSGLYILNDMDSDSYLKFHMKKYGSLMVSGEIGGTHTSNYLVFEFASDQTVLNNIIKFFKKVIEHRGTVL